MKHFLLLLLCLFTATSMFAQKLNFQGVARNNSGTVLANQAIKVRLSIRDGNAAGVIQYSETRTVTTSAYGSFKIIIGSTGALASSGSLAAVTWAAAAKFLQVEVDPANGNTFTDMGTTEMVTVPTAVYASTAGSAAPNGSAGGDLSGTYPSPSVTKLLGRTISTTAPTNGQVLKFDGSVWAPAADNNGGIGWSLNGNDLFNTNTAFVGIGTNIPKAKLHVADNSVLFSGPNFTPANPLAPPASGGGIRMMWYMDKAAFRTGLATGNEWDKDSIGDMSFAAGYSVKAKGRASIATGDGSFAGGNTSFATGRFTKALGENSFVSGNESIASGLSSFAAGNYAEAKGTWSAAIGYYTTAKAISSITLGSLNDDTDNPNPTTEAATDRIFQIGNGSLAGRGNALTVLRNGNIGINTTSPVTKLHIANSSVLFSGPGTISSNPAAPPVSGAGVRMMWYPDKAAFRTGRTFYDEWDKDNVGLYSFAAGYAVVANGEGSVSLGYDTRASGISSFASGKGARASGDYSVSLGRNNAATGRVSFSTGEGSSAEGEVAIAIGKSVYAKAMYSFSIGALNDITDNPDLSFPSATDRIFQIGNGMFDVRSNAVTILRNGKAGFGTVTPQNQFEIVGPASSTPVTLTLANRGAFGPAAIEFVSDYGLTNKWRPGYIRSNDAGGFTGSLEFYTNGTGSGNLYGNVKGLEVRNGTVYTATGSVSAFSDVRLKNNIQQFTDGLNVIEQINPVTFYYNADAPFKTDAAQVGVVAQELETIAPYMVQQTSYNNVNDIRYVDNQAYTFLLINAVKELKQQNEALQKRVEQLERKQRKKKS